MWFVVGDGAGVVVVVVCVVIVIDLLAGIVFT